MAEELGRPPDDVSVERTYRAWHFFYRAAAQGQATDGVAYLAAPRQAGRGILQRRRPKRARERLAHQPPDLNL